MGKIEGPPHGAAPPLDFRGLLSQAVPNHGPYMVRLVESLTDCLIHNFLLRKAEKKS
jgi:hypothetical protein